MAKRHREPCAFCPETANITGEHLWSAWAGKMFGKRQYTITRKELDGQVRTWKLPHLSQKARVVCGDCNNGWMSDLENRVKPIIGEVVQKSAETSLICTDIATIAAWIYTKAIVAEHSHQNTIPFWTFAERQLFRETLSIPDGVQMWLAGLPFTQGLFKSYLVRTPFNTPQRFELNVFTYGLGHFVVQVLSARWARKAFRRIDIHLRLSRLLNGMMSRFLFGPAMASRSCGLPADICSIKRLSSSSSVGRILSAAGRASLELIVFIPLAPEHSP